ncbi:MAG TPA: PHB depolymerase family esterase [Pseudoduganella sp.]
MAKANTVARLLRSLARAGKAQQRLAAKLITKSAPKAAKRTSSKAKKTPGGAHIALLRQHNRPDVTPAPGKWSTGQFSYVPQPHESRVPRMSYWLYMPEHVPAAATRKGVPLLVMLHGCHQSATQFARATRMNHHAERKGFAVLYPQQSLGVQAQRCWRWYSLTVQHGSGETAALSQLIEMICAQQFIDRRRIYACGISAGAGMAAILALNHPELIAAVGLHSGPVFGAGRNAVEGLRVMKHGSVIAVHTAIDRVLEHRATQHSVGKLLPPMPALLIHGNDDHVVASVNQQQLAQQWLRLNGRPHGAMADSVTVKPHGRGASRNSHEIHEYLLNQKPILRVVRIGGLGHAWSGGDPSERFTSKTGPDSSRMMIDFFSKHQR